jgi:hypothetical protein
VSVNEGNDILGEVGCVDGDRGKLRGLSKALHESAPVDNSLDPPHRPTSIDEYATARRAIRDYQGDTSGSKVGGG